MKAQTIPKVSRKYHELGGFWLTPVPSRLYNRAMARLTISLFGAFQVQLDGQPVTRFESDKVRALLAYLAVEAARPHRREHLAGLLWPDQPEAAARHNLSQTLLRLRQAIGDRQARPPFLLITPQTIQFNPASDTWLDVAAFTAYTAASATVEALTQTLTHYTGDFLAGFYGVDSDLFEEWVLARREELRRHALLALDRLVGQYEEQGAYELAHPYAQQLLDLDSLREESHRRLMRLLALNGPPRAGMAPDLDCCRVPPGGKGVGPPPETTAVVEQIRRGEVRQGDTETRRHGEGVQGSKRDGESRRPIDGGKERANDQLTIDHSQLIIDHLHNLPAQTTPFVGRETELAEVTRLLTSPQVRLLTIVGQGGIGKTRLARQSGRRLLNHFPDGVWYLSLAAVDGDSSGRILNPLSSGLAGVLGLTLRGGSTPEAQVLAHLQERRLLLILDNLEHVLESSAVISTLLSGAAGITVLATSRERLNLQEEWLFPLEGLALPTTEGEEVAKPEMTEAVQLFTQVAQRVLPAFDPQSDWRAIAQICRLVEGMPLGIELAASWVRYMAPAEIAQEIEGSIDFLTTNVRNLPARHRSLRAVFDHSWQLLSPQEQTVLPQLSVFRGGFRYQEAQSVAAASRLTLTTLVDKSLLWVTANGRYDLHERLRQYLLDKLRQDLSLYQSTHERHSQVYLALLHFGPVELGRETNLQRINDDYDNVRAAWQWAMAHAQWSAVRHTQRGMAWFHSYQGRLFEASELFEKAISDLEQRTKSILPANSAPPDRSLTEAPLLLAAMRCLHSERQVRIGIHDPARMSIVEENLAILRALGPEAHSELADALFAAIAPERRRTIDGHDAKLRYAKEGLELCQALDYAAGQSRALYGLGVASWLVGQLEMTGTYARQLLALAEPAGDAFHTAVAYDVLGDLARARGDYAQAERHYESALQRLLSISPHFPYLVFCLSGLANVARLRGDFAQAAAYLQQSEVVVNENDHGHPADFRRHEFLLATGHLAETQGELVAAQQAFHTICQQDQAQSHYSPAALIGLGWVALQREDWSAVRRHFATAFPLIVQLETAPQALDALAGVAHWLARTGQPEQALALIGLVQHHPSSYQESKDRLADLEAELRAKLSPEQVQVALARGRAAELWATVAALRSQFGSEAQPTQPVQEVRIEVDKGGVAQQVSTITGTDYFKQL